jgi:hypothetical protein
VLVVRYIQNFQKYALTLADVWNNLGLHQKSPFCHLRRAADEKKLQLTGPKNYVLQFMSAHSQQRDKLW